MERLRRYYCLLSRETVGQEVGGGLFAAVERLEDPAKVSERERRAKERGEKLEVEGGVINERAVYKAPPDYPVEARQRRLSGKVVMRVLVNEEGKVISAQRVCGSPVLGEAAVRAVYKWRFSPTTLDGEPVKVAGTVTINFSIR